MDSQGSDKGKTGALVAREKAPLSGEQLAAAVKELEMPRFLDRLTARIMKFARQKGFQSPFEEDMDLPGGKSAGDLAVDIIAKVLDGSYSWDSDKFPTFRHFCLSRAESILSNWLDKNRRLSTMSPILEDEDGLDGANLNPVNSAVFPLDLYAFLQQQDESTMGDQFLEDFALSLPDPSHEQSIVMAIFDNRDCANRASCIDHLRLSERDYDAAVKRLLRRLPLFRDEWVVKNNISLDEWRAAQ